jgi:hypothetical protein
MTTPQPAIADPATRAADVLRKLATIANQELPCGYSLELSLTPPGQTFAGESVVVFQMSDPLCPVHEKATA